MVNSPSVPEGVVDTAKMVVVVALATALAGSLAYLLYTFGMLMMAIETITWAAIVATIWFVGPMVAGSMWPDFLNKINFKLGLAPVENPIFDDDGSEYRLIEDEDEDIGPSGRREMLGRKNVGVAWRPESFPGETFGSDPEELPYDGITVIPDGGDDGDTSRIEDVNLSDKLMGAFPYVEDGERLILKDEILPWAGKGADELVDQVKKQTLSGTTQGSNDRLYYMVLFGMAFTSMVLTTVVLFVLPKL